MTLRKIGSGGFGDVFAGKHHEYDDLAIKFFKMHTTETVEKQREVL